MRSSAVAIVFAALGYLTCWSLAGEVTDPNFATRAQLAPGIGTHDRRVRVDPDELPWRAVGKLQASSINSRLLCTATLVGPSTVVTAAHCLFNPRTLGYFPPASLHFLIGYDAGRYAGHAVGIRVKIADGYDPSRPKETMGSDCALVSLDKTLGSPDRVLPVLSEPPDDGAGVVLGGYQQDHPLLLLADTRCQVVGRLTDADGLALLRHNCNGTKGASGAPLLVNRGGKWRIAAIEVAAELDNAGGAAVVLAPYQTTNSGSPRLLPFAG